MRSVFVSLVALGLALPVSAIAQELTPSNGASASATSVELARASKMWISGDYQGAVSLWQSLPDNRDALYNLGQAYRLGRGVAMNLKQSRSFYEKALEAGHPKAAEQLGLMLFNDASTRASSIPFLTQAVVNGSPRAEMALGLWNMEGTDRPDFDAARVYLSNAAAARIPGSAAALAKLSLKAGYSSEPVSQTAQAAIAAATVADVVVATAAPTTVVAATAPVSVATMGLPSDGPLTSDRPVAVAVVSAPAVSAAVIPAAPVSAIPLALPQTVMQVEASDEVLVYSSPSGNYTRKARPSDGAQAAPVVIWW